MSVPLTKVDSAIAGLSIQDEKAPAPTEKEVPKDKKSHRRTSSTQEGVFNIKDLGKSSLTSLDLQLIISQRNARSNSPSPLKPRRRGGKLTSPSRFPIRMGSLTSPSRRLNKSPSTVEDKDILKLYLVTPPVKKIDLHFPLGLEVTARNLKGVTIKDALDAIYKQYKKKVSIISHPPGIIIQTL